MKKFALLLLTGLLTALLICFVAVSSAEDEISFRNIPWGISLEDAEEMIRQDKIDSDARFDKDYDRCGCGCCLGWQLFFVAESII